MFILVLSTEWFKQVRITFHENAKKENRRGNYSAYDVKSNAKPLVCAHKHVIGSCMTVHVGLKLTRQLLLPIEGPNRANAFDRIVRMNKYWTSSFVKVRKIYK